MKTLSKIKLHIVAFDIPYPPNYGGAIDVFYKVKFLSEAGVDIYLHCPQYADRVPGKELETLCKQVFYYHRETGLSGISARVPYMVYSRRSKELLHNLVEIEAPILFDGVSTAFYLSHPSLKQRTKILRPQNVEQDYFSQLAKREKSYLKRLYYLLEAKLLKQYENKLKAADAFFTVAQHDHDFFAKKYPQSYHQYLPSFQPYVKIESLVGTGNFCLYHGNLALAENEEAALFLLDHIVPHLKCPFILAGRNPGKHLLQQAALLPNCMVKANPTMAEMDQLIATAQIHCLPTFQNTGLKLKLLHALFKGRHVLVNENMVHGTGLNEACCVCTTPTQMIKSINELINQPITERDLNYRQSILEAHYNNRKNAQAIITYLQLKSL
ncbi:MAG: glycosyltransferase [Bacteroidetes bacterium]|nr:glycosyltransferase [Bacteroidota bacterium]